MESAEYGIPNLEAGGAIVSHQIGEAVTLAPKIGIKNPNKINKNESLQ